MAAAVAVGCSAGPAQARNAADDWQWDLTPYLWLPTIDGAANFDPPPAGGGAPEISVGPVDWFKLLNFGVLVSAGGTKDRLGLFTDFVFLRMSSNNEGELISAEGAISGPGGMISVPVGADVNIATDTELDGILWSLAAGYAYTDAHYLIGGFRLLTTDISADWNLSGSITGPGGETILAAQGSIGDDTDLWDGIVGLKGHFELGEGNWSLPYTVDIGAGDSDLVWSATVSLVRRYGWGDIVFGYRHLEYDEGSGGLLRDFSFSGPGFGARFHF